MTLCWRNRRFRRLLAGVSPRNFAVNGGRGRNFARQVGYKITISEAVSSLLKRKGC
ncbi:hypothetical protein COLO4_07817 [Corchorus olitorius]|uniref:Uncharacterized protein n=1 Tax=Corchorus olitorius TaxID=93759 RepID=A0A1R3KIG9_9ROSI|nr:hypothetical protein COLO4_07817 [Corchorus olitorius]